MQSSYNNLQPRFSRAWAKSRLLKRSVSHSAPIAVALARTRESPGVAPELRSVSMEQASSRKTLSHISLKKKLPRDRNLIRTHIQDVQWLKALSFLPRRGSSINGLNTIEWIISEGCDFKNKYKHLLGAVVVVELSGGEPSENQGTLSALRRRNLWSSHCSFSLGVTWSWWLHRQTWSRRGAWSRIPLSPSRTRTYPHLTTSLPKVMALSPCPRSITQLLVSLRRSTGNLDGYRSALVPEQAISRLSYPTESNCSDIWIVNRKRQPQYKTQVWASDVWNRACLFLLIPRGEAKHANDNISTVSYSSYRDVRFFKSYWVIEESHLDKPHSLVGCS